MIIASNAEASENKYRLFDILATAFGGMFYILYILMSVGILTAYGVIIGTAMITQLILVNLELMHMGKHEMQKSVDQGPSYQIKSKPILAPIQLIAGLGVWYLLFTGSLYMWPMYLVYAAAILIIHHAWKKHYNITESKEKKA